MSFATRAILVGLLACAVGPFAAAQTWVQQFPAGTPPVARYSLGNAYDAANDRLIFFGGEDHLGLPRPTDVWVLNGATGATPSWTQLATTGGPPFGRFGTTEVYAPSSNRLIVHAGCGGNCTPMLNDTWVLTNANGSGGPPAWINISSAPIARGEHAAVYDDASNRMIIFGGHTGFPATEQNDVWVLTNADGTGGPPVWSQLLPSGPPPSPRRPYAMAYDASSNRMIVFGGLDTIPCCSSVNVHNDVWVLTHANGLGGTPQWIQLTPSGGPPPARAANSATYDAATNRLIVYGGSPGSFPPPPFGDVWVLNGANGLAGTPQWVQLTPGGTAPLPRSSHVAGYNAANDRLVIAMGRNDALPPPLVLNDVWVLDNVSGVIEVEIDIKPGSDPNGINPGAKGKIPVAILTTSTADGDPIDFDAWDVDASTVAFGATGTEASIVHAQGHAEDVDGDGDLDMVVHFRTRDTGIACGDTEAFLTGETFGGQQFAGSDSIQTAGCQTTRTRAIGRDLARGSGPGDRVARSPGERGRREAGKKVRLDRRPPPD